MKNPSIRFFFGLGYLIFLLSCKDLKERSSDLSATDNSGASQGQVFLQGVDPGVTKLFRGNTQPIAEWEPLSTVIITGDIVNQRFGFELLQKLVLTGLRGIIFVGVNNPELQKKYGNFVDTKAPIQFIGISTSANKDHPSLTQRTHTVWTRDYGPIMARGIDGSPKMFNFRYYEYRDLDNQFNTALLESLKTKVHILPVGMNFEGGNFMTDGETCIYSDAVRQYHGYNLQDVNAIFRDYMGCKKVLTTPAVAHEATGHVDMVMKFVRKNEVVLAKLFRNPNPTQEEHTLNLEVKKSLDQIHDSLVKAGIKVTRIPMPAVRIVNGNPVFFSYTNSLISNGHIIMPVYGTDIDGNQALNAQNIYKSFNYTVHTVDSREIILKGGAVHCSTMQIPSYKQAWHDHFYDELRRRRLLHSKDKVN